MSSTITQLFTNQTTDANSASFVCSINENQTKAVQGLQILGVQDGAAIDLEQFNAAESDEADSANWSAMSLENPITVGMFFPIGDLPDKLKLRVAISDAGASTDISVNLISQQK